MEKLSGYCDIALSSSTFLLVHRQSIEMSLRKVRDAHEEPGRVDNTHRPHPNLAMPLQLREGIESVPPFLRAEHVEDIVDEVHTAQAIDI